jgi:ATPase subunit of ABC transporter with duplicated ATPase domains
LILDEPTNDLDVETLELLEELIDGYQGTVMLVSDNRRYIGRYARRPRRSSTRSRCCRQIDGRGSPASRCPVRALSGGERNRLLLARLFLKPSNLLILDEPTNDQEVLQIAQHVTRLTVNHHLLFTFRKVIHHRAVRIGA